MVAGLPDFTNNDYIDLSKRASIDSEIVNHTRLGSLFNCFDYDTLTSLEYQSLATALTTTTLILDIGYIFKIHNTLVNFSLNNSSVTTTITFTLDYSTDKINWVNIVDIERIATLTRDYDAFVTGAIYRYLRFTITTKGNTTNKRVFINEILLIL